tara:strand:- start:4593 stop:5276 length:684 start_codon:yes stop_codon:yes gene_type:complete
MTNFSLLILSAGFGKRMLNLTKNTPKPLLKFRNNTLLENAINFFSDIGCNEIFINTHYLHETIETYVNNNFANSHIKLIHEPIILGTGGGVKNVFNFTKINNLCVVNSDIFWQIDNKTDIINFLKNINEVTHCKILLSKKNHFSGLTSSEGDFIIKNNTVSKWSKGKEIIFYSGFQIVSKNVFKNSKKKIFSMNEIWNKLIIDKKLQGQLAISDILHIGDKKAFTEG